MQQLLIGLLCLVSLNTFARVNHVEPSDSIELIPEGSKVTFIRDFNVKPRLREHKIGESKTYVCYMFLNLEGVSSKDRIIYSGKSFEVEYLGMGFPRFDVKNEEKIETIYCKSKVGKEKDLQMSVAEFIEAIAETLVLKMSDPYEF